MLYVEAVHILCMFIAKNDLHQEHMTEVPLHFSLDRSYIFPMDDFISLFHVLSNKFLESVLTYLFSYY